MNHEKTTAGLTLKLESWFLGALIFACLTVLAWPSMKTRAKTRQPSLLSALAQKNQQNHELAQSLTLQLIDPQSGGAFSGFLVSESMVVTDQHHLKSQQAGIYQVSVLPGGRTRSSDQQVFAKFLAADNRLKVGVLRLVDQDSQVVKLSYKRLRLSEFRRGTLVTCFGIGDLQLKSVLGHSGIVSAMNRFSGRARQLSCQVDPIFAGGPVFDYQGGLCGLTVVLPKRLEYNSGVGFFIPMQSILKGLPQMARGQVLDPASLKIFVPEREDPLFQGVPIVKVKGDSPLVAHGIQRGDQILKLGGVTIRNIADLQRSLEAHHAGQRVEITILSINTGQRRKLAITLARKS